jgi:hypothetical protein
LIFIRRRDKDSFAIATGEGVELFHAELTIRRLTQRFDVMYKTWQVMYKTRYSLIAGGLLPIVIDREGRRLA